MNRQLERKEQVELVAELKSAFPNLLFWATPNGGKRDIKTAINMKREGVRAGVPDLFFPSLHLFIEMKAKSGKVSKDQAETMRVLTECGYECLVCYSAVEALKEVAMRV